MNRTSDISPEPEPGTEAPPAHPGRRLPQSFAQEQLWFLAELSDGDPTYNISVLYRLRGQLDTEALRLAFDYVVSRHDALRTTFDAVGGTPVATTADSMRAELGMQDLSGLPASTREAAAAERAQAAASAPFDLRTGPLFRLTLIRLAPDEHLLSVVIHHIVCDGWSFGVLYAELAQAYSAIAAGRPAAPGRPARYSDYVAWQRRLSFDSQLAYWEKQLTEIPVLDLPADRARPPLAGHRGETVTVAFPRTLLSGLRTQARGMGVSLFSVVATALGIVLGRYSGQEDIAIGTTMPGRPRPEFENLIGFFVNMVVLRLDLSGNPALADVAERVHATTLGAIDHQDVPFEKVVEHLRVSRDLARNPLFQVSMQVLSEQTGGARLELEGVAAAPITCDTGRARFDLAFSFTESADDLSLSLEYSTELFDRRRIEQLTRHLERALAAVSADPSRPLSEVELVSAAERDWLLAAGTGSPESVRPDPLHVMVAEQAARAPEALAAVYEGRELTYGELDSASGALALRLRSLGVQHEEVVAVALKRGHDALVAFLGILKAGAAFVALDTDHPVGRIEFILGDTSARVVITDSQQLGRLPDPAGRHYLLMDEEPRASAPAAAPPLAEWATGSSLAYVLYTSGSTGKPKGVLVEHRAVVTFVTAFSALFGFGPGHRILQYASLAFDLSEGEIFSALTTGAALVLARQDTLQSPEALAELIRRERVTYVGAPPAMLSLIEPGPFPDLRHVLVGGESCPADLVNQWNLPGRLFVHGYGPTEAAIGCTLYPCERLEWPGTPPIGGPMPNRLLYVVDQWGSLVPPGVPGELLIGGDEGLARGYLNRPDLTSDRFIPDPFREHGRVYRSGDLVSWTPNGVLEFAGRVDSQIKLNGLRIELEEIETVLASHASVARAVVVIYEGPAGGKSLAAYVTPAGAAPPDPAELRTFAGTQLPGYMVPSTCTVLDSLPLTVTGKVNRGALPPPGAFRATQRDYVAPSGPREAQIATAFAEVLGIPPERVSADDDFFDLGGNSLQAMRVVSRINRAMQTRIGVRELYGASTVSTMAAHAATAAMADPEARPARPQGPVAARDGTRGPRPAESGLSPWLTQEIISIFREVLPGAPGDLDMYDNLFSLDGAEPEAARVLELMEGRLGVSLSTRSLFTVGVLAAAADVERASAGTSRPTTQPPRASLLALAQPDGAPALFCLPAVAGSAYSYVGLGRALTPGHAVLALETPGLDDDASPLLERLPDLASAYIAAMRERQPEGPYLMAGWSMGGLVSFEMARQLVAAGAEVGFLGLIDTVVPEGRTAAGAPPDEDEILRRFIHDMARSAGQPVPALGPIPAGAGQRARFELVRDLLYQAVLSPDVSEDTLRRRYEVFCANTRAAATYTASWHFPGRITLIRGAASAGTRKEWVPLAASVEDHVIPGDHYSMWDASRLPSLAALLEDCLARAGGRQGPL